MSGVGEMGGSQTCGLNYRRFLLIQWVIVLSAITVLVYCLVLISVEVVSSLLYVDIIRLANS